jgi:formylglycine-generating enzyme required for sulfatase activity
MIKRRIQLILIFALSCSLLFQTVGVVAEDIQGPGITQEKPASGPFVETDQGYMIPYSVTIPGSEIKFEMIPCPGGKFKMGSPESEEGRKDDEGPQVEIEVAPFWMGKTEVTWKEYKEYMSLHDIFKEFKAIKIRPITEENAAKVTTAPSNLYDPSFTFKAGSGPDQPAVTMTQFAAKQYTKWLSGLTGTFYRLPSEAEWEYACRAGTSTAYSFGDDPDQLGDYAWFKDNSDELRHDVAQKKPNPWGLYDMHGSAAEWVLDAYSEDGYQDSEGKVLSAAEAVNWPTEEYPRVVRGGSWENSAKKCRSAARVGSEDEDWKEEDPNFPLSPFWYTSSPATGVGMRIMRPLHAPKSVAEKSRYWDADIEQIQMDVEHRIKNEGRGAEGVVDSELPQAIIDLKDK